MHVSASVPGVFVWSRVGPESGERLEQVVERKERQRAANGRVFLWGIGHSIQAGVRRLLEFGAEPRVLFTRIAGKGAVIDSNPDGLLLWRAYYESEEVRPLPSGAIVVSRSHTGLGMKTRQYALFCESEEPLSLSSVGSFRRDDVVNIESGRPVGASQTTAVVRYVGGGFGSVVDVVLNLRLAPPYAAQLADPIPVTADALAQAYDGNDWIAAVEELKSGTAASRRS